MQSCLRDNYMVFIVQILVVLIPKAAVYQARL